MRLSEIRVQCNVCQDDGRPVILGVVESTPKVTARSQWTRRTAMRVVMDDQCDRWSCLGVDVALTARATMRLDVSRSDQWL